MLSQVGLAGFAGDREEMDSTHPKLGVVMNQFIAIFENRIGI